MFDQEQTGYCRPSSYLVIKVIVKNAETLHLDPDSDVHVKGPT